MAIEIIMPKAGMAMEEGKIIKWLVKEGEAVVKGEPLLEIETDKVSMEVEASDSGTLLKILAQDGETVPVIQTIGYIGKAGESIGAPAPAEKSAVQAEKPGDYDVIVVGGGPAGYIAAIKAAQLGGKVALVEKQTVGGTCLNRGCIPTKTYLKSAEILHAMKSSANRGISVDPAAVSFDMPTALKNKNEVVKKLTNGVATLLKSNGITVIKGEGIIRQAGAVLVNGQEISAKAVIFAGGSMPGKINIPGIDSRLVLNSDEMLDLDKVPKRLAIIGGGVIGVELGLAFAEFGSQVTVIEMMDNIVPNMDTEISVLLKAMLKKRGLTILTSASLKEIIEEGGGLNLVLADGTAIEADKALLSIGRKPDLSGIEGLGLELQNGRVKVDDRMETSIPGIYAPGDVNGIWMLAHAAFKMGEIAAENALGGNEKYDRRNVPSCIYTLPEVGSIGLTEKQAAASRDISVGRFHFASNGRALASGEGHGFVKVISDKKYGEILGVHIIGPGAAEMINEASVLMSMEITADEVAKIVHAHPTFSESLMEAAADTLGLCMHLPKK